MFYSYGLYNFSSTACSIYASAGYAQQRLLCSHYVPLSRCPVSTRTRPQQGRVHYTHAAEAPPWPRAVFNSCGSDPKTDSSLSQMVFIACQHIDARYWYSNSVCPSVCLSVMFRYQTNHSSFISIKHLHEIPTGSPCGGAKYRWGIKISQFSTNKSLYLANDTRYRVVTMEGE